MSVSTKSFDYASPSLPLLLGIEIGGTKLQLVVGNAQGVIIDRRRSIIDAKLGAESILQSIRRHLADLMNLHVIHAIGVGYGGPVDWKTGRIVRSYQIAGWDDFELGKWLIEKSGVPVIVDNDANVAALAEARHGAGRGHDSVVYVTLGSGVGAGLVINGKIYHGASPGELELGHVQLNEQGLTVQQRCSGWAVDAIIREAVSASPESELAAQWRAMRKNGSTSATGGEAKCLKGALERDCDVAKEIVDGTMKQLAMALSHVVHLLHPHAIVIGGGLSLVGQPLIESLSKAMKSLIMDAFQPGPHLALAQLGEDVVPVGALTIAGSLLV